MTFLTALQQTVFLALSLATMAFFVAGGAFIAYEFVSKRDRLARRVDSIRRQPAEPEAAHVPHVVRPATTLTWLGRAGLDMREAREVSRLLGRLGVPVESAPAVFFAFRVALVALMAGGLAWLAAGADAASLAQRPLVVAILGAFLGWFAPYLWVRMAAARRMEAVEAGLPEALELLVVAVEAGLALEDGIQRISGELYRSQPALADELAITSADLRILPSRDLALANFAKRVDVPSVRSVVTTLSQTMRYGTPLAQALRTVAAELRNDSLIKLEERANKLPTLLTVPMMLFILPSIFLIIGGPAAIRLIDTFLK